MDEERRKFVRVKTPNTVANSRVFEKEVNGDYHFNVWPVENISMGGTAVRSDEHVNEDSEAFMNIDLNEIFRTIGIIARVVRCVKKQPGYELGLSFQHWADDTADPQALTDYICTRILEDKCTEKLKNIKPDQEPEE